MPCSNNSSMSLEAASVAVPARSEKKIEKGRRRWMLLYAPAVLAVVAVFGSIISRSDDTNKMLMAQESTEHSRQQARERERVMKEHGENFVGFLKIRIRISPSTHKKKRKKTHTGTAAREAAGRLYREREKRKRLVEAMAMRRENKNKKPITYYIKSIFFQGELTTEKIIFECVLLLRAPPNRIVKTLSHSRLGFS